jgi:hypothetical protein
LAFYADVGEPPAGLTIERFNNDVGYQPGNVGWASVTSQLANRRPPKKPKRKNGGGT